MPRVARDTAILRSAAELFRKRGFAAVGVDEIGRSAGITGPAIYRHFKGKDDILGALFDEGMDEIFEVTAGTFEDPRDELRHVALEHGRHLLRNTRLASVWIREDRSLVEPYRRRFQRRAERYLERWTETIGRCYPGADPKRCRIAAVTAINGLNGVVTWPPEARTEEHLATAVEMLIAGLATLNGRR
jgi:AcrR family transcriptional regulator